MFNIAFFLIIAALASVGQAYNQDDCKDHDHETDTPVVCFDRTTGRCSCLASAMDCPSVISYDLGSTSECLDVCGDERELCAGPGLCFCVSSSNPDPRICNEQTPVVASVESGDACGSICSLITGAPSSPSMLLNRKRRFANRRLFQKKIKSRHVKATSPHMQRKLR